MPRAPFAELGGACRGRVLRDHDPEWDGQRAAVNVLVDQHPAAIVVAAGPEDVAATLTFAAEHELRVAPQLNGHGSCALGDVGADTILLRTSRLNEIEFQDGWARAGAGTTWRDVVMGAAQQGATAMHGSSLEVGVVGYTLGGGIGWYGRPYGLACDHMRAADVVLPDGRLVRAYAGSEPDLFWALKGGGANFGVVTALEFDLLPIGSVYAGALSFPLERAREVLHAWNEWITSVPDHVTSLGRIVRMPDIAGLPDLIRGRALVLIEAAALCTEVEGSTLIEPLRALGPTDDTFASIPTPALGSLHMDPEGQGPGITGHALLAGGEETIDAFIDATGPDADCPLVSVEIRHTGAALAQSSPDRGALPGISGEFCMFLIGAPLERGEDQAIRACLNDVEEAMDPHRTGNYLNFVERPIDDALAAFPPDSGRRLAAIRASYDPMGVMRAHHQLGVPYPT